MKKKPAPPARPIYAHPEAIVGGQSCRHCAVFLDEPGQWQLCDGCWRRVINHASQIAAKKIARHEAETGCIQPPSEAEREFADLRQALINELTFYVEPIRKEEL